LNALEESLRASSLALAFGVFDEVDLTAGRRLSLAAGKGRTPCLLMTHPGSAPAGATATRWRVARAPSAPHPFDARAPGHTRFLLNIERCRTRPESAAHAPLLVEWCHETRRFDLAAVVADPAARPRRTDSGSLTAAVRTG
jgi:protein ImuA